MYHPDNPHVMRAEFYGSGAHVAEDAVVAFPWLCTVNANVKRYGNQDGISEVQLAVSRDLEKWARPFRTPVIRRGKLTEWDCGFFSTASQTVVVGDEVWLYYGGFNFGHGAPTGDPAEAEQLEMNAATKPAGSIVVELLAAAGRPLPGYVSAPFRGDELRHPVRFADAVGKLAGKPVSLRFRLQGAALFSFAFRE